MNEEIKNFEEHFKKYGDTVRFEFSTDSFTLVIFNFENNAKNVFEVVDQINNTFPDSRILSFTVVDRVFKLKAVNK